MTLSKNSVAANWKWILLALGLSAGVGYVLFVFLVFSDLASAPGGNEATIVARLDGSEIVVISDECTQRATSMIVGVSTDGENFDRRIEGPIPVEDDNRVRLQGDALEGVLPDQLIGVTLYQGDKFLDQADGTFAAFSSTGISNIGDLEPGQFESLGDSLCSS